MGRQVAGQNYTPTNKNPLIRALTEEWDKLPQQLLDTVCCAKYGLLSGAVGLHPWLLVSVHDGDKLSDWQLTSLIPPKPSLKLEA
ncbi:hypothetical protein TNCV_2737601 [Trichonephila clavipes]|nr:hypothetical protein TNCV_2737601 [Trichonephila clavipes]